MDSQQPSKFKSRKRRKWFLASDFGIIRANDEILLNFNNSVVQRADAKALCEEHNQIMDEYSIQLQCLIEIEEALDSIFTQPTASCYEQSHHNLERLRKKITEAIRDHDKALEMV